MAKYHSAKELGDNILQNGDRVVFSKEISLTYRVGKEALGRSDVYDITNDLIRVFGRDVFYNFAKDNGYSVSGYHGILWGSYEKATEVVKGLFALCTGAVAEADSEIKISSQVLGDIYSNVCGDWQNKLEREFPNFPFSALHVYSLGQTFQPGYFSIIDSSNEAVPGEILLVNNGRVQRRVIVQNVNKIFGYELNPKLKQPEDVVSINVRAAFLKTGYRSANDYVKGLILEHVIMKSGIKMYTIGDKIGTYTVVKIDEGTAGLLSNNQIVSMAKLVEGERLAMTDFSNLDTLKITI